MGRVGKSFEDRLGRKVLVRLVLPSALFILFGAIDRTNVGFAALQMNQALGLSGTEYGFGAGILFVGYLLAKYPSVLLYERLGMHRWLAAISICWGLGACLLGFVQNGWQLYILRLFIGFAEGGLSSGLMIYLSHWAAERHRASILAIPIMAISIAQVVGAPASGFLLDWDNPMGVEPWRLMFVVEGLPAVAMGVAAYFIYPDSPAQAKWLSIEEREWLAANVKGADKPASGERPPGRWGALSNPLGWLCAAIWFCILASNYGVMFWLPQIVKGLADVSALQTGWIVALPWAGSALGLVLNARHSDLTQERYLHVALPSLAGGAGLLCAYLLGPGLPGLLMLIFGGACTGCTVAAFWAIPTRLLRPAEMAMGIVFINVMGSFAGATVPGLMGFLAETSGSYFPPTLLLFGLSATCFLLCLIARAMANRRVPITQH